MVKIYVRRINDGLMTIEEVPTLWREKTQSVLDEQAQLEE